MLFFLKNGVYYTMNGLFNCFGDNKNEPSYRNLVLFGRFNGELKHSDCSTFPDFIHCSFINL